MKIIYKILIPVAILMALALSVVSFIGYTNISKEIDNVMHLTTEQTLEDIIVEHDIFKNINDNITEALNENYIRLSKSLAIRIAENPTLINTDKLIAITKYLNIDEIHIINSDGILYAGSVPEFYNFDFSTTDQTKPFLDILKNSDIELAQKAQPRGEDGKLFQYIAVSIPGRNEILQIGISPDKLQVLADSTNMQRIIESFHYQEGGYAYVLDPITKLCTEHINTKLIGYDMTTLDFALKIFEMKEGSFSYIWKENLIYTTFKTTPSGIVVAAIPESTYTASLGPIKIALLTASLISLIILVIFTIILLRKIIRPLRLLNKSLIDISQGNADLTKRINVKSHDEIGDVARNFNVFISKLQVLISDIQKAVSDTTFIKDNVVVNTNQNSESIIEITNSIEIMGNGITEVQTMVKDSATTMDKITRNTKTFDELITSQSAMVEESTAAITEMIASLDNVGRITTDKKQATLTLNKIAGDGKIVIQETSKDFSIVASKIQNIKEMADTINDIAARTDLLSMNAAIEAVHAGDAGKGFSVVAEEIRKLAVTSASASEGITAHVNQIIDGMSATTESMGIAVKTFDSISNEVISTVNAFDEIQNSVSELSIGDQQIMKSTDDINNITSKVHRGSKDITDGISTINTIFVDIKSSTLNAGSSIQSVNIMTSDVMDSTNKLKEISNELDKITISLSNGFDQFETGK